MIHEEALYQVYIPLPLRGIDVLATGVIESRWLAVTVQRTTSLAHCVGIPADTAADDAGIVDDRRHRQLAAAQHCQIGIHSSCGLCRRKMSVCLSHAGIMSKRLNLS